MEDGCGVSAHSCDVESQNAMGEVEVTARDGTIGVFENFRFCDSDGEKRSRRSSLRILLRFADAAGLVRSVGDMGRGVEKHSLRSPPSAFVAGATRRNTLVGCL